MASKVHPMAFHLDAFAQGHVDQMAAHLRGDHHRWDVDRADAHDRDKLIAVHNLDHDIIVICWLPQVPPQGGAR